VVVDLATGVRRVLFASEHDLVTPLWSPDSQRIASLWATDTFQPAPLIAVNADGSETQPPRPWPGVLLNQPDLLYVVAWTRRGVVGGTYRSDGESEAVAVYRANIGDLQLHPGSGVLVNDYAAAATTGGETIAYLAAPVGRGRWASGLRLTTPSGADDRSVGMCSGTSGADLILGSPLADRVEAGAGDDVVRVLGGGRDVVRCGSGRDQVVADRADQVAPNCERVYRIPNARL
jgi:hypothetical protein